MKESEAPPRSRLNRFLGMILCIICLFALVHVASWVQAANGCIATRDDAVATNRHYEGLLAGKQVRQAKGVTGEQVKDPRTVTILAEDLKRTGPDIPFCTVASTYEGIPDIDRVRERNGRLGKAEAWYAKQIRTVKADVKAVLSSRDDKTLADAQAVYDTSAGRVADENTRTVLKATLVMKDAKGAKRAAQAVKIDMGHRSDAHP